MIRAFFGVTRKQSCKSVLGCDQKECLHAITLETSVQRHWLHGADVVTWLALTREPVQPANPGTLVPAEEGRQRPGFDPRSGFVRG